MGRHDDRAWALDAYGFGRLAEFERDLIRARTGEGRERAKARGVHMGRPPALTRHQREEALRDFAKGKATQADLARRFNVSRRYHFKTLC